MLTPTCPRCGSDRRQTRAGRTACGSPRSHCVACDKDYTPRPKRPGYPARTRHEAVALHLEGLPFRAVARILSVNPQSVANWVAAHQAALEEGGRSCAPAPPVAAETVEMDEVQVFVGARKGEKNAGPT